MRVYLPCAVRKSVQMQRKRGYATHTLNLAGSFVWDERGRILDGDCVLPMLA
jgi:hypothetical protein